SRPGRNATRCSIGAYEADPLGYVVRPVTQNVGAVLLGNIADANITVLNDQSAVLSGSVSVDAPFSILGSPLLNISPGSSQTITVRFAPTDAGPFQSNVIFATDTGNSRGLISGVGVSTTSFRGPSIKALSTTVGVPGDIITISGKNFGAVAGTLAFGASAIQ